MEPPLITTTCTGFILKRSYCTGDAIARFRVKRDAIARYSVIVSSGFLCFKAVFFLTVLIQLTRIAVHLPSNAHKLNWKGQNRRASQCTRTRLGGGDRRRRPRRRRRRRPRIYEPPDDTDDRARYGRTGGNERRFKYEERKYENAELLASLFFQFYDRNIKCINPGSFAPLLYDKEGPNFVKLSSKNRNFLKSLRSNMQQITV